MESQSAVSADQLDRSKFIQAPVVSEEGLEDLVGTLSFFIQCHVKDTEYLLQTGVSLDDKNWCSSLHILFNISGGIQTGNQVYNLRIPPVQFFDDDRISCLFDEIYMGKLQVPLTTDGITYEYTLKVWLKEGLKMKRYSSIKFLKDFVYWVVGSRTDIIKRTSGQPTGDRRLVFLRSVATRDLYIDVKRDRQIEILPGQQEVIGAAYSALTQKFKESILTIAQRFLEVPNLFMTYQSIRLIKESSDVMKETAQMNYPSSLLSSFWNDVYDMAKSKIDEVAQLVKNCTQDTKVQFIQNCSQAETKDAIVRQFYQYQQDTTSSGVSNKISQEYLSKFRHGNCHIHPGFSAWFRFPGNSGISQRFGTTDLMVFDTSYIVQILLFCNWVRRVILPQKNDVRNDSSVLLLFGDSGAGKSHFVHVLKQIMRLYRWSLNSNFQAPDILDAQFIVLEDIKLRPLLTNTSNKNLLDFENSVEVDMKYASKVDLSYQCPVIITTNDSLSDIVSDRELGQTHITAFRRRIFPVSCTGKYKDKHVKCKTVDQGIYEKFDQLNSFELLNSILALSLLMEDQTDGCPYPKINIDRDLTDYYGHLLESFYETSFCRLFMSQRDSFLKAIKTYYDSARDDTVQSSHLQQIQGVMVQNIDRFILKFTMGLDISDEGYESSDSFTLNNYFREQILKHTWEFIPEVIPSYFMKKIQFGQSQLLLYLNEFYEGKPVYSVVGSQQSIESERLIPSAAKLPREVHDRFNEQILQKRLRPQIDNDMDLDELVAEFDIGEQILNQQFKRQLTSAEKKFMEQINISASKRESERIAHEFNEMNQEEEKVSREEMMRIRRRLSFDDRDSVFQDGQEQDVLDYFGTDKATVVQTELDHQLALELQYSDNGTNPDE